MAFCLIPLFYSQVSSLVFLQQIFFFFTFFLYGSYFDFS